MADPPVRGEIVPAKRALVLDADAFAALNEIVSAAREYGRIREEEQTKRAAIAAEEHIQVDRIHAADLPAIASSDLGAPPQLIFPFRQ